MLEELDETPMPELESEPPEDEKLLGGAAVDDDSDEADDPDPDAE